MGFLTLFILFGLLYASSNGQAQTGTSRDGTCCDCSTTNWANCNSATLASNPPRLVANCPNGDCSLCPSCELKADPDFSKQCSANIVFIVDNSGSLQDYCESTVRPALWGLFDGFQNVANVGGNIRAAVVAFSQRVDLVFPMTTISPTYLTSVKSWIGGYPANGHPGYCQDMSGTNWGGALNFARQQNYGVTVDIWIFFTDGFPQCAGTFAPQPNCGRKCYDYDDNFFFERLCNPASSCDENYDKQGLIMDYVSTDTRSGTWSACYAADQIKATGAKLFVVGVGGVDGHESKIQAVSGTRRWDMLPSTFGKSDYVISTDLSNLGVIFQQVVAGLCDCLQGTIPCSAVPGEATCQATQFDAYFRVTSRSTSVSTVFPIEGVAVGYIYYSLLPSPNTRVAYQFWAAGKNIGSTPGVVRTDILNPCDIQRRVNCGGGCVSISEKSRLPRFFRESTDIGCGGPRCTGAAYVPTQCARGFIKQATNPEEIKYIWTLSNGITPCAALANDGTFYEFFTSNNVANVGVNRLGSTPQTLPAGTPAFDFTQITGGTCPIPQCASSIELLLIIDEQTGIAASTYTAMKNFAANIVNRLQPGPTYSSDTRFGLGFTSSYGPPFSQAPSILTGMSPTPNFVTNLLLPHAKAGDGKSDFGAAATYLINKYWGNAAPNGVQRVVLFIIGGGDGALFPNYAALQTLYTTRDVEAFVVGVDQGASQLSLMRNLASPGSFQHYNAVLNPANLNKGGGYEGLTIQSICPQTNACGANCKGFCECITTPTCKCSVCNTNPKCTTYQCTNPAVGCKGQPFNCNDNAACTIDSCTEPLGCSYQPKNCQPNEACVNSTGECIVGTACVVPNTDPCPKSDCYTTTCEDNICKFTSIVCDDNDPCTVDSCVNPGGCKYERFQCEQSSTCFITECVGVLANGQPDCRPTIPINCTDNDGCTIDSCVEDFGCQTKNYTCQPTSDCNFPVACVGKDGNGVEQSPHCIISNLTCFAYVDVGAIAGITAGVIAGIVVAAVVAAALIAFFSKKGYDAYKAKSDMGVSTMMQNPTFTQNTAAGDTPF